MKLHLNTPKVQLMICEQTVLFAAARKTKGLAVAPLGVVKLLWYMSADCNIYVCYIYFRVRAIAILQVPEHLTVAVRRP